jgi:hypothetical protein
MFSRWLETLMQSDRPPEAQLARLGLIAALPRRRPALSSAFAGRQ